MTSRVIVSMRVQAAADRAFAVFVEEIGAWWRPDAMFAVTPRSPGALSFEPGPNGRLVETLPNGHAYEIGRVLDWSPPVGSGAGRLAFAWRPASVVAEQATEVVVSFEPAGQGETRVTVEHIGWDRVPQDNPARHGFPLAFTLARAGDWWTAELAAYKTRLGGWR